MEHNYFWKTLVYDFESHTRRNRKCRRPEFTKPLQKCTVFLLENKTNGNAETKSDWTQSPKKNQPTVFTSEVKQKLCHMSIKSEYTQN
jgi:hypothetical protein